MDIIAGLIIFASVLMNIEIPLFSFLIDTTGSAVEIIKDIYFNHKEQHFYIVWIINLLAIISVIYLICIHS